MCLLARDLEAYGFVGRAAAGLAGPHRGACLARLLPLWLGLLLASSAAWRLAVVTAAAAAAAAVACGAPERRTHASRAIPTEGDDLSPSRVAAANRGGADPRDVRSRAMTATPSVGPAQRTKEFDK